jgi:hypothetical protein
MPPRKIFCAGDLVAPRGEDQARLGNSREIRGQRVHRAEDGARAGPRIAVPGVAGTFVTMAMVKRSPSLPA